MFSIIFWRATAERAVKTFAQAAGALLISNGTGLLDTDWKGVASAAGIAAVISVLTSIGSDALTGNGPSLTNAEVVEGE